MADIKFKYTDSDGNVYDGDTLYQCEYASLIYVENPDNEVVYLTEINILNGNKDMYIPDDNIHLFKANHKYLIAINDLDGNVIVEQMAVYEVKHGRHENVYGICESSKCKVPLIFISPCDYKNKIHSINKANTTWTATENGWLYAEIETDDKWKTARLYIDGVEVFNEGGGVPLAYSFYIQKGTVIKTGSDGRYTLNFYGCVKNV